MTETYELFQKWWKTLPSGARRYLDPDNTNVGLASFEAGHAAGRLEGLEEAAKWLDEQKKFMGSNEPSILSKEIRALAPERHKDKNS